MMELFSFKPWAFRDCCYNDRLKLLLSSYNTGTLGIRREGRSTKCRSANPLQVQRWVRSKTTQTLLEASV